MDFEKSDNDQVWDVDAILRKFWGNVSSMITGPEHEYIYLRGIIEKAHKLKADEEKQMKQLLNKKLKNKLFSNFTGTIGKINAAARLNAFKN